MDFAVRLLFFPFILAFKLAGEFFNEIMGFIIKKLFKLFVFLLKHFFWSVISITIKGNTIERIIFIAFVAIDHICYVNGYYIVRCVITAIIMIIGGLKNVK